MSKVVLLDIDYTLFNTDKFRDITYPRLQSILEQKDTPQYHARVKEIEKLLIRQGGYEPVSFAKTLAKALQIPEEKKEIEELFYNKNTYSTCLYADVIKVIEVLSHKSNTILGIVSQGEDSFQRRKIQPIVHYFQESNIFISTNKIELIKDIFKKYQGKKIFVVDDSEKFLYTLMQEDENVFTFLIERENRYEGRKKIEGFIPNKRIKTLNEIFPLVDKLGEN